MRTARLRLPYMLQQPQPDVDPKGVLKWTSLNGSPMMTLDVTCMDVPGLMSRAGGTLPDLSHRGTLPHLSGGVPHHVTYLFPPHEQTDAFENITFPQMYFAGGKNTEIRWPNVHISTFLFYYLLLFKSIQKNWSIYLYWSHTRSICSSTDTFPGRRYNNSY